MKKLVASIAASAIIAGATVTTASAAEYQVEKGDNLWSIAQQNNTTVQELVEINNLNTTVIQPKQELKIDENQSKTHTVVKGDTLFGIGQEYNVSVANLKAWNNLHSDLIIVGQNLAVNGAAKQTAAAPQAATNNNAAEAKQTKEQTQAPKAEQTNTAKKESKSNTTAQATSKQKSKSQDAPQGKTLSVSATAYTAGCAGCSGVTATGVDLNANPNAKVIAVDPNVIPLGSKVYVEGYGYATAADTGGAINGNKIDIHVPTKGEAYNWGVRNVNVTIVD